jgi:hypothetical protein
MDDIMKLFSFCDSWKKERERKKGRKEGMTKEGVKYVMIENCSKI